MTEKQTYQPSHHRIFSLRQKKRILHVEDSLDIGKIRFDLYVYSAGSGAHQNADAYIDTDLARTLFFELTAGHLDLTDNLQIRGGGRSNGQTVARILTLQNADTDNPIRISVSHGPGQRMANGLITPAGWDQNPGKVIRIHMLVSRLDAVSLGLAGLHHLQAWAHHTYADRMQQVWTPEPQDTHPDSRTVGSATNPAGIGLCPDCKSKPCICANLQTPPAPDADALTGEIHSNGPTPLTYANGDTVSDNLKEQQAWLAYLQHNLQPPADRGILRVWAVQNKDKLPPWD